MVLISEEQWTNADQVIIKVNLDMRLWLDIGRKCHYSHTIMIRMRDLETKEAYRHERKLTAKKIRRQREKRSNSTALFFFGDQQRLADKISNGRVRSKSTTAESEKSSIPRTQSAPPDGLWRQYLTTDVFDEPSSAPPDDR